MSLAPSCTEILYALGLGNKTVGTVSYENYPANIQTWVNQSGVANIGDFSQVNLEAIKSLNPDLVLGTGGYQDPTTQALENLGIPVLTLSPDGFAGVLKDIALVGNITGQISEQKVLVANLTAEAAAITEKTQESKQNQRLRGILL